MNNIYKFKEDSYPAIAATLLLGEKYSKLSNMIENQDRISSTVLQRILDDLLEADRRIGLRIINRDTFKSHILQEIAPIDNKGDE